MTMKLLNLRGFFWLKVTVFVCLCFFLDSASLAQTSNDLQNWSLITLNKKLDDKWGLYLEAQNRLGQNFTGQRRLLIRPALVYKLDSHTALWLGYAWTPSFTDGDLNNESRIWQQIAHNRHLTEKLEAFSYLRLEERFIEGADSMSLRQRMLLGLKYPIFNSKSWKWIAFDEIFINYYSVDNGPAAGLDQNRIFLGVEKTFNSHTSLTAGYLLDHILGAAADDQLIHSIRTQLNINF